MANLPGRLGTLTACNVMTKKVVTVVDTDSLSDAIEKLKENHISGVPVVNEAGKLVGILAISDLVRKDAATKDDQEESPPVALAHGRDTTTWDLFEKAGSIDQESSEAAVAERMSRQITSVTEEAPLVEVARVMCSGHWHRVPVVDNTGSLTGIISTMDVLAAVVNTADEVG